MSAIASPDDLIDRHDVEVIGDLATDKRAPMSRLEIRSSPKVMTALQDATGEVEVAMLRGGTYRPEHLATLQDAQLGHLKRIVCWIAMALLFERRPGVHEEKAERYLARAQDYLLALQKGDNVFGIDDDRIKKGQPTVGGMTSVEYQNNNLVTERMDRFFPSTASRLPLGRG